MRNSKVKKPSAKVRERERVQTHATIAQMAQRADAKHVPNACTMCGGSGFITCATLDPVPCIVQKRCVMCTGRNGSTAAKPVQASKQTKRTKKTQ